MSPRPAKSASASAPAGSPTPAVKRIKVEPSAPSMSSRTAKAQRVEALRKQLEDAQKAMDELDVERQKTSDERAKGASMSNYQVWSC